MCYASRLLCIIHAMEEEIQCVLGVIDALDKKFSSSIMELKNKVTAGQEAASQEVVKRIDKRSYQFQKKGNDTQFLFNATVDEHVDVAKKELAKVIPGAMEEQQVTIKKAVLELDKGSKAIATRQKHIRITDRLELGWNVVAAYETDELVDNSKDEKRLFRAQKEVEKKQQQKRKWKHNPTWVQRNVQLSPVFPRYHLEGEEIWGADLLPPDQG